MKKIVSIVSALVMVILLLPINIAIVSASGFAGGNGTKDDPYQISTADQFNAIRNDLGAHYVLIDDIDLGVYTLWTPIGDKSNAFSGSLNGNQYTIAYSKNNNNNKFKGVFGKGNNCELIDIIIENVAINMENDIVGGLIGEVSNSFIKGCSINGILENLESCGYVGGLIGKTSSCSIENCNSQMKIIIDSEQPITYLKVGGIIGSDSGSVVKNCRTNSTFSIKGICSATAATQNHTNIGGIIGGSSSKKIINCCSEGTINSSLNVNKVNSNIFIGIGGITGGSSGEILNCSSNMNINSDIKTTLETRSRVYTNNYVGGISKTAGLIKNCISSGNITVAITEKTDSTSAEYCYVNALAGGIVAHSESSIDIINCISEGDLKVSTYGVCPESNAGGIIGMIQSGSEYDKYTINSCMSKGNIESITNNNKGNAGGIVGKCKRRKLYGSMDMGEGTVIVEEKNYYMDDNIDGIAFGYFSETNNVILTDDSTLITMQLSDVVTINGENSVQNNKETILKATRYDENGNVAPEGGIVWSCSDESVAQITPWGNNVTVKGLKGGKVTITAAHAESGMSATHELEVKDDMQISINAIQNADGIKTKYIDAMHEDKLSINVTNIPENTVPEIKVSFDKDDFLEVGELKEVPAIQTETTGIAKQYELTIKGLQNGKVKVTAILKTEQETKEDTAEIIIRSPKVYNNNVELTFGKALPYIENERMFVGAEKFFGLVGGTAQEQEKAVVATHNDTRFIYTEGQDFVAVNDTGATVRNIPVKQSTGEGDKLYVPLRFTAENYNGYVQWNNDEYAAYITDDERSDYISKVKRYCFNYPQSEKPLYFAQQEAYKNLIDNEKYLSYLFMKEYSEIDTSSLSAFMADVTKKGIINTTALVFNDEMWTRLWNYLKASHSDPTMFIDGVDEVEKEKYKDALKSYIESTHQKRTTDKIVEVIDNVTDPLKSAKSSISSATSPIKLDLKIDASADDLKETRKMLTDLGVSSDLSDVSDYAKHVDTLLDEFDTLSAVGTVSDIAGWGFILTDGLSDMMKTLGNYHTMNEYVSELDSMANNTSLPASLREAAKELKAEISGNMDDAIRAPLKRMFDTAGEELTSDGLKTIASGTGATVAAQIFAGVSIAKFIGNLTAGVDDVIKNISYVQMWGFLQDAEVERLNSLATDFNKLYKAEKDIDEVYAAAEKVEESYKRLHNYRIQGEQTYRYLQSGDYAVIDLQSLTGSDDSVEYADNNIKMLNDISFK